MIQRAKTLRNNGEFSEALAILTKYYSSLSSKQEVERIKCLNEQSQCFWGTGDLIKAEKYAQQALTIAKKTPPDDQGQAEALRNLGIVFLRKNELDQAEIFQNQSLKLYRELNDDLDIAKSLITLGIIFYEKRDFGLAESCYTESLELCQKINDIECVASSLNNLGVIYWHRGELNRAEECYKKSLEMSKQLNNQRGIAYCLNNLGEIYWIRGELNQAENVYKESLAIKKRIGNPQDIAFSLKNLGIVYREKGDLDKAENHLIESLTHWKQIGNVLNIAESLYQLGKTQLLRGLMSETLEQIRNLSKLSKENKSGEIISRHALLKAGFDLKRHQLTSAFNNATLAKDQAAEVPHFELQIESMHILVQTLIEFYLVTKQEEYRLQVDILLTEISKLSKQNQLHRSYIESLLMLGFMKQGTLDFAKAAQLFSITELLAEERGILHLVNKARNELLSVQELVSQLESIFISDSTRMVGSKLSLELSKLNSFLKALHGPTNFDPSQTFMIAIKFEDLGPKVFLHEDLPFSIDQPEELFIKMSVYFSTAIGQGSAHYEGLYGPLPLTKGYSSLIFACKLPDSEIQDYRMKGNTYALFCLGYPNGFDHFFTDRIILANIFNQWTTQFNDVSEITINLLKELRELVLSSCT